MAAAKRIRWECPNGLHPGVLASSRPRKNATARYCLACSETAGVLVERTAPALERKRNAKTAVREEKRARERAAAAEARENWHKVTVLDRDGGEVVLDAGELLRDAWRTPVLRDEQRAAFPSYLWPVKVPELVIRRGAPTAGRPAARAERGLNERSLPIRARDGLSGHAESATGDRIVMTVRPNCGEEWVRAIVVHEAAHAACPIGAHHGARWRRAYVKATRLLYPGAPIPAMAELDGLTNWQLDEAIAQAIYERRS